MGLGRVVRPRGDGRRRACGCGHPGCVAGIHRRRRLSADRGAVPRGMDVSPLALSSLSARISACACPPRAGGDANAAVSGSSALLRGFARDDVAVWRDDGDRLRPVGAGNFCGAVLRLSRRLPAASHAINYCEDPLSFLLAGAAALAAGQTLILPQSRARQSIATLVAHYPDAYCLADGGVPMGPDARAYIVAEDDEPDTGLVAWPPPEIANSHAAAILFTSGTTGVAQAHP